MNEVRLAAILGVTPGDIADFEEGAARVGAERLALIGRALNAPVHYFFEETKAVDGSLDAAAPVTAFAPLPGARELVSAYARIANPQLRGVVLDLALTLAGENSGSSQTGERPPSSGHSQTSAR